MAFKLKKEKKFSTKTLHAIPVRFVFKVHIWKKKITIIHFHCNEIPIRNSEENFIQFFGWSVYIEIFG